MIAKVGSGRGFGGLTRYLTGKGEGMAWSSVRNLPTDRPGEAAVLMRATAASSSSRCEQPVYHLSLSLSPGEHLSPGQWSGVVERTLSDLGLGEHQALVIAHRDREHEHVHVMVNRVHPETGRAWDRWQDRPKLVAAMRSREADLGLRVAAAQIPKGEQIPSPVLRQLERTGRPPLVDYARSFRGQFAEAKSWSELHGRLAKEGLYLERRGQGLTVTDDSGVHVKGSTVGRECSLRALERRLGAWEPARGLGEELVPSAQALGRAMVLLPEAKGYFEAQRGVHEPNLFASSARSALEKAGQRLEREAAAVYREPGRAAEAIREHVVRGGSPESVSADPRAFGELLGRGVRMGSTEVSLSRERERALDAARHVASAAAGYEHGLRYVREREGELSRAEEKVATEARACAPVLEELGTLRVDAEVLYGPERQGWSSRGALSYPEAVHVARDVLCRRLAEARPAAQRAIAEAIPANLRGGLRLESLEPPHRALGVVDSRLAYWSARGARPHRELTQAIVRSLGRSGVSRADLGGSTWAERALELGARPAHVLQAMLLQQVPAGRVIALAAKLVTNPAQMPEQVLRGLGIPTSAFGLGVAAVRGAVQLVRGGMSLGGED